MLRSFRFPIRFRRCAHREAREAEMATKLGKEDEDEEVPVRRGIRPCW